MGADTALVNASYAASMANVPGDWSKIFNKQYEGLLLAHTAKWKAFGDAITKVGDLATTSIAQQKLWDQASTAMDEDWEQYRKSIFESIGVSPTTIAELAINNTKKGADDNVEHYESGGPLPAGHFNAIQERFENLKSEIKKIDDKGIRSKKDRKERVKLYKNYELLKQEMIKDKAAAIQYHSAGSGENSLIDWTTMKEQANKGKLDAELVALIKHVHDPKIDFEDYGIRVRINDKNEKVIDYFEGRLGIEYTVNNGGSLFNMMTYGTTPKTKSIKYQDLMKILKYKPLEQVNNIDGIFDNVEAQATAVIKGTKTPAHGSWSNDITGGLKSETRKSIMAELKNPEILNYLATNDLFDTGRIYANDVDSIIDVLTYQKILGKDLSQFDISGPGGKPDGVIDRTELSGIGENFLSKKDKAKVKEVLIDPTTESELVIAQNELADYFLNLAKQHFETNKPAKTLSAEELAALNKSKTGIPWAPTPAVTEEEKVKHALVKSVMNNQRVIKYTENKKTFTWTRTVDRQGRVEYVSGKQRMSRVEMIQLLGRGNEAGNIPNDFDWTTIGAEASTPYVG